MKGIRFGIIWFMIFLIIATIFSPEHYRSLVYTISELAHQGYSRAWILLIGFYGNGFILLLSGAYYFKKTVLPTFLSKGTMLSGVFIIGLGLFQTNYDYYGLRPDDNIFFMLMHIVFALLNQGTFYMMVLYHIKHSDQQMMKKHRLLLVLNILFAVIFSVTPIYRGTFQRLIFIISGIWFWFYFNQFKKT